MTGWASFARTLFDLEDADPGYNMLARVSWPTAQKQRFMTGWCTYYNPGIAARASELTGTMFWKYLYSQYSTAKRASERRHFRGRSGLVALAQWQGKFKHPEEMVEFMQGKTYFEVREKAKQVAQIGPYFVWKFADVQERVFCVPCDFTGAEKHSPKVPQEGAQLIAAEEQCTMDTKQVYDMVITFLEGRNAPPWYDRPCNMQEAETVACVYHQKLGGGWHDHTRTAKAARRLMSIPCKASDALLDALFNKTQGKNLPRYRNYPETRRWVSQILDD